MALFGSGDQSLNIVVKLKDEASKKLKNIEGSFDKLSKKAKQHQGAFTAMAAAGTAGFVAIGAGAFQAAQAAADAQEVFNKFEVVFDDVDKKAEKTAQNLKKNWGLAESSAKELLAGTGDLLVGIGLTGDEALELSDKTVQLGIDLASFQNYAGGATGAVEALTKGLLGEREMLKGLGIVILESDLKLRLIENGTDELAGTALKAARAEATLQLAMEQSEKAQGDYHRTQGSVVNRQRELQERAKELNETFGNIFIPLLAEIVEKMMPLVEKLTEWIEKNPELTKLIVLASIATAGLVGVIGMLGLLLPGIIALFAALTAITLPMIMVAVALAVAIGALIIIGWKLYKDWDLIVKGYKLIWEDLEEKVNEKINEIKESLANLGEFFIEVWDGIMKTVESSVDFINRQIQRVIDAYEKLKAIAGSPLVGAKGLWESATSRASGLFNREHGGLVPGAIGMPVPIIAHGGERIIPASSVESSGGNTFVTNINNPVVRDDSDIDKIEEAVERIFRGVFLNNKVEV